MSVWSCLWSVEDEETYRWTLSTVPVTESLTFSVVGLELLGVAWSATSVRWVSEGALMRSGRHELSERSLRLESDMLTEVGCLVLVVCGLMV